MVWGFFADGETGSPVTVQMGSAKVPAAVGPDQATGNTTTWRALLPATAASFDKYTITATTKGVTINITGVMFGDVWVCSGQVLTEEGGITMTNCTSQSNMEYPLGTHNCWNASTNCSVTPHERQCSFGCVNNSEVEIAHMQDWDDALRMLLVHGDASKVAMPEMKNSIGWVPPSVMGGQFSAACYFFGRDVFHYLNSTGQARPIGLIGSYVGGTPDEHWSSQDALDKCKGKGE